MNRTLFIDLIKENESIKEIIINIVIKTIDNELSETNLFNGKAGVALFLSEYIKSFPNEKCTSEKFYNLLDELRIDLMQHSIGGNYASGLSGVTSAYNVIQKNIGNSVVEIDSKIDELIMNSFLESINRGKYELLNGGLGYIMHFLNRPDTVAQYYLPTMINKIGSIAKTNVNGIYWTSYFKTLYDNSFVDMGLSHGMAALVNIFSMIPSNIPNLDYRLWLVENIISFYKENRNGEEKYNNSIFPYGISKKNYERNCRLAWCYGDAGIGISFLNAGIALFNNDLENFGKDILFHSINRKDIGLNGVMDPYFCHGSAGVAVIFLNVYKKTKEEVFKDAANYWLNVTLKFLQDKSFSRIGFLTGLSGIGLVLLSFINEENLAWEKLVLLN